MSYNDEKLVWDGLNLQKRKLSVNKNQPQDIGMSSSYVRAPTTQEALKGKLKPSQEESEHILP